MAHATAQCFGPRPLGPWGGTKRSNLIIITKSISNIFKPNFVCLLTNERYKTYKTGFSFSHLGHAPGWDFGDTGGLVGQKIVFPKFNQIWFVSHSHEWQVQRHIFLVPTPLGRGQEVKKHQIQFQIFLNQILCVFSQMKDTKHFRWDFHLVAWVMPQGWCWGVKTLIFKHGHVAYQIKWDGQQTRIQWKKLP